MCGIIGYKGKNEALPVLLNGLKRMEYRGYDSAGVAVIREDTVLDCMKSVGTVSVLEHRLDSADPAYQDFFGYTGIGHTRWATHGVPNDINAHPHLDCETEIAIVHNGIIENHETLKKRLIAEGHRFASETDSEVLAHMIEKFHKDLDLESAVQQALTFVEGAYAILVISEKEPDKLIGAKFGSPLLIGVGNDEVFLASDYAGIIDHTKQTIVLMDGEMVVMSDETPYRIRKIQKNISVSRPTQTIDWDITQVEKGGYEHFMHKEIHEEAEAVRNTLRGRINMTEGDALLGGLSKVNDRLKNLEGIQIVACGTSYFSGIFGKYLFEEIGDVSCNAEIASEFRYRKSLLSSPRSALLAITQTGETADTLACVKEANRKGILTLGIVNVVGSSIARDVHAGVYNHVGPEIAVASTKAFISQLIVLTLMGIKLGRMRGIAMSEGQALLSALNELPEKIHNILSQEEAIRNIAQEFYKYEDFAFLGRKFNTAAAMEGALKLKEISYIHAEAYTGGELKHGAIALIDENFPSVYVAPKDSVYEKNMSNMQEIKARRGTIIAVATRGDEAITKLADRVLYIPQTLEIFNPVLASVALHLFAYHMAKFRGLDIDKPRNLAKCVTVE